MTQCAETTHASIDSCFFSVQELASLKKDMKKDSAQATGSASSSYKVYLGLQYKL